MPCGIGICLGLCGAAGRRRARPGVCRRSRCSKSGRCSCDATSRSESDDRRRRIRQPDHDGLGLLRLRRRTGTGISAVPVSGALVTKSITAKSAARASAAADGRDRRRDAQCDRPGECGCRPFPRREDSVSRETEDTRSSLMSPARRFEEYVEVCARLDDIHRVDMIELNISCPNVSEGGMEFGSNAVDDRADDRCRQEGVPAAADCEALAECYRVSWRSPKRPSRAAPMLSR